MTLRPDKTVEGITLQGIVSAADGKRKAIINNEVVGEGEQVDFSIEILNIYADSVTVRAPIRQRRRK